MIRRKPKGREEAITRQLYAGYAKREWKRLVKDGYHRLEFETTLFFLKRHLPRKGLILDAGGGPGRYTIELAAKGYDMVLFDLTPENLNIARIQISRAGVKRNVRSIEEGSILDLSRFPSNSFDAVLCLGGPLSHVGSAAKRGKAVSELIRVAKPNAPIFLSAMGKLAVLQLVSEEAQLEMKMKNHYERLLYKGDDYLWGSGGEGVHGQTGYCHYFTLNELRSLFESRNCRYIESVGLEGLSSPLEDQVNEMFIKDKKAWKSWLKTHYATCTNPSVADTSSHMLVIYRKYHKR